MTKVLFGLWVGLAGANFAFQGFVNHDWNTAFDRSFFQGVALIGVYFLT